MKYLAVETDITKRKHQRNSPTRTLAAGLSTPIAFRMVAPSFVTWMLWCLSDDCRILSCHTEHSRSVHNW